MRQRPIRTERLIVPVSPHMQFTLADLAGMLIMLPVCVQSWHSWHPHHALVLAFYTAGYGVIAAGLVFDSLVNPPLFVHGLVGGVGIGLLVACIAVFTQDVRGVRAEAVSRLSAPPRLDSQS